MYYGVAIEERVKLANTRQGSDRRRGRVGSSSVDSRAVKTITTRHARRDVTVIGVVYGGEEVG